MPDDGVIASAMHSHPSAVDARKLSVEQQKQLLGSIYAAFWTFKIIAAAVVICILGLHGACCLFPNYKTSDAVRCSALPRGCASSAFVRNVRQGAINIDCVSSLHFAHPSPPPQAGLFQLLLSFAHRSLPAWHCK